MPALGALEISTATIDGMYSLTTALDLLAGEDDGRERELAHRVRKEMGVRRDG